MPNDFGLDRSLNDDGDTYTHADMVATVNAVGVGQIASGLWVPTVVNDAGEELSGTSMHTENFTHGANIAPTERSWPPTRSRSGGAMARRKGSNGFRRDRLIEPHIGAVVDLERQGPLLEELGHLARVWDTPEPLPSVLALLERCGDQPDPAGHLAVYAAYVRRLDPAALLDERPVGEWIGESADRSAAVRALLDR